MRYRQYLYLTCCSRDKIWSRTAKREKETPRKWGFSFCFKLSNSNKWVNKKFASEQLDEESDLQYFEKRYYDTRIWRFTTEDPVFWEVWLTKRPSQYYTDPQQWNSYSYVRNNPINYVDPTGELLDTIWDIWNVTYYATKIVKNGLEMAYEWTRNAYWTYTNNQQLIQESQQAWEQDKKELWEWLIDAGTDAIAAVVPFVPAGTSKTLRIVDKANDAGLATKTFSLDSKILWQMEKRWWTENAIEKALESKNIAPAIDKSTWQKATAYFVNTNQYVVKNDETGRIIQISNLNDKAWKVDATINITTKK